MNDLIRGEFFRNLCDFGFGENTIQMRYNKCIVMYANTHDREQALSLIEQKPTLEFILVTHNSDQLADETEIPKNLKRWYAQNLNFSHPKVFALPIGLENRHWHPHKQEIFDNKPTFQTRLIKPFAQFNSATYRQDRVPLLERIHQKKIDADIYNCLNGTAYGLFIENLRKYAFCLCPRGNGIDTHRIWEALYMGCIPIVKRHYAHPFESQLPILFVDGWEEINQDLLQHTYKNIDKSLFQSELLSLKYWKKIITNRETDYA